MYLSNRVIYIAHTRNILTPCPARGIAGKKKPLFNPAQFNRPYQNKS